VTDYDKSYARVRAGMRLVFNLLARIEIHGLENVPEEGGFILATNHISRLDAPLLMLTCPRRVNVFVAEKYRNFIGFNWILKATDAIWVKRGEADRMALRRALEVLGRGEVLGMAPEGTRSRDATLQRAKPGVAFLAVRAKVPVVPVAVTGTQELAAYLSRLRRVPLSVTFGEPLLLTPGEGERVSSAYLETASDQVMARIAALLPGEYRGVYADAVA